MVLSPMMTVAYTLLVHVVCGEKVYCERRGKKCSH